MEEQKKSMLNKKNVSFLLIVLGVLTIIFFQIRKSNNDDEVVNKNIEVPKEVSEYDILLDQKPVYRDSTYFIYITKINETPKIIYLKKGSINEVQKESKFFLHIYPKDSALLKENRNLVGFDFKNNVKEVNLRGKKVYISETNLPEIGIKKINTGQYGFRGNSDVSWKIKKLLSAEEIRKDLLENDEDDIYFFDNE